MQVTSIESSLNKTYRWLNELKETGHFRDESQSYSVLKVVLHHLRDYLPLDLSTHLAAQFPLILKGVYYDGWDPIKKPKHHEETFEEFIQPMAKDLSNLDVNLKDSVKSCMKFIFEKLDPGIVEKVLQALPLRIRQAFLN